MGMILAAWVALCVTTAPTPTIPLPYPIGAGTMPVPKPSPPALLVPEPVPELAVPWIPAPRLKPMRGENRFRHIILQAAHRHRVDPALVRAVIRAESGYDHRAVSRKGALGLMQLMPATAKDLGVEDAFDPVHNINGGVKYLRQLIDQFDGNVRLALAAYNAGCGKVRQYRGVPPYPSTRFYLEKVIRYYRSYKRQMTVETENV
jgi:soluble lytic murein transglycosylase-like protein